MRPLPFIAISVAGVWGAVGCHQDKSSHPLPTNDVPVAVATPTAPPPVDVPALHELMGQVKPASDSAFSELPEGMASRRGLFLRNEACEAFKRMHEAALKDGIVLTALSATRSFNHQASIWNRKWNRPQSMGMAPLERAKHILLFSSMPGSSRHHWGTDVDIHSLDPEAFESGTGAAILGWLRTHGEEHGFVEVYTNDSNRTGYQPEAWHWSYAPLARPYLHALNEAQQAGDLPDFSGFEGAELADSLHIVRDYINGINATL